MKHRIPPKELRALWAEIPKMKDCKGLCANSCGPIGCSTVERELMEQRAGKPLEVDSATRSCSMLKNGLCSVYSIRPTLCRLWGAVEGMRCPHGCEPERMLTDLEGMSILARSMDDDDPEGMAMAQQVLQQLSPEEWESYREWIRTNSPDLRPTEVLTK